MHTSIEDWFNHDPIFYLCNLPKCFCTSQLLINSIAAQGRGVGGRVLRRENSVRGKPEGG